MSPICDPTKIHDTKIIQISFKDPKIHKLESKPVHGAFHFGMHQNNFYYELYIQIL